MNTLRSLAVVLMASLLSTSAAAQTADPAADTKQREPVDVFQEAGILVFQTPDQQFKWWLDGRLMLDAATYFNSVNTLANGAELRRGRFAMNFQLWETWVAQFDVDFADGAVGVKDAWIGYQGIPNSLIRAGNFRAPFGLETLTSSRYITFMERALTDNFSPDRRIGIAYSFWQKRWHAEAGFFGPALEDTVDTIGQDQTYSVTGRVVGRPYLHGNNFIHLGAAWSMMQPKAAANATLSDAHRWRVRARPESHVNRGRFIDTGQVTQVEHANLYGLEAVAAFGAVSIQAEYNQETLHRTVSTLPKPMYDGWYTFVSWFPTGERRPYDVPSGEFVRVIPRHKRGALELVARYSSMDLNDVDANVRGGKEEIFTAGFNWYANANIRLMTNFLNVSNDEFAKGDRNYITGDRFNVLQVRLQLNF